MTACFFLLAVGAAAAGVALRRRARAEAWLMAAAGLALALLGFFPTDLADLTTDAVTCGQPGRIEPCTLVGRVHNPLSTAVFVPIGLAIVLLCVRSRREPEWRGAARLAGMCAGLALVCLTAAALYKQAAGLSGRHWTGLEQRSLVLPALLWVAGLMLQAKPPLPQEMDRSPTDPPA